MGATEHCCNSAGCATANGCAALTLQREKYVRNNCLLLPVAEVPVPASVSLAGRGTSAGPSFVTGRNAEMRSSSASSVFYYYVLPLIRVSLYELSPRRQPLRISHRLTARRSGIRDFGHRALCLQTTKYLTLYEL